MHRIRLPRLAVLIAGLASLIGPATAEATVFDAPPKPSQARQTEAPTGLMWVNPKTIDADDAERFPFVVKAGIHPTREFDVAVCRRTYADGSTFAGKAHWDKVSRQVECFIAYRGREIQHRLGDYEVLRSAAPEGAPWTPAIDLSGEELKSFALPVGMAKLGGATAKPILTYVCQMVLHGKDGVGVHVGWFEGDRRKCHISWGGKEMIYPEDKALILMAR